MIAKVHDHTEGRYELDSLDLHIIHAMLSELHNSKLDPRDLGLNKTVAKVCKSSSKTKPSSVDTNIEEKKKHMDSLIQKHLKKFTENNLYSLSLKHFTETGHASGSFRESLHEMMKEYATTTPVQEKPDLQPELNRLTSLLEAETSRAEGWRKQYYDWKDLLLTTQEENRQLKQEIERLKIMVNTSGKTT